eukprot:CAMPEP_0175834596 /NCGR_PEP_ID=MMETSP0107_2-20121207/16141_1 /TAXON_ID=195067 ORGANISM="Goniomonas pacifica, Strain CCMP1869" /NCGR_SAMPLE_ID=MMETSP0107_2 /ASSEMBLY_ACC=CAM_ASM_000203 /LENGTH=60 /DNA_ID=CAMNT_0017147829 /DNA_START=463 /DNA_END=645 /DNA_ORIENTATION=-
MAIAFAAAVALSAAAMAAFAATVALSAAAVAAIAAAVAGSGFPGWARFRVWQRFSACRNT